MRSAECGVRNGRRRIPWYVLRVPLRRPDLARSFHGLPELYDSSNSSRSFTNSHQTVLGSRLCCAAVRRVGATRGGSQGSSHGQTFRIYGNHANHEICSVKIRRKRVQSHSDAEWEGLPTASRAGARRSNPSGPSFWDESRAVGGFQVLPSTTRRYSRMQFCATTAVLGYVRLCSVIRKKLLPRSLRGEEGVERPMARWQMANVRGAPRETGAPSQRAKSMQFSAACIDGNGLRL